MAKKLQAEPITCEEEEISESVAPASDWSPRFDDGAGLLRPPGSPTHSFERKPGSSSCSRCGQGVQHANHEEPLADPR